MRICAHCNEPLYKYGVVEHCINPDCGAYDEDAHNFASRTSKVQPTLSEMINEERRSTRTIEVELTDEELIDLGVRLAKAITEQKGIPNKLKAIRAFINESSLIIQTKKEMREVPVTESFDYAAGVYRCLHQGQIIEERPLTQDEKQMRVQG